MDLPTEFKTRRHRTQDSDIALKPTHKVNVEGSPLANIAGTTSSVNFLICISGFRMPPEDGLIEAAYMPDHPYMCLVQWHPEELYPQCEVSRTLFDHFIKACAQ